MDTASYVDSYYAATAHPSPLRPPLAGTLECDVGVIGGGIAGCSAALHLAERGYRVTLLEAHRVGWGASGRSGAQAIAGVACGQEKLEHLVGTDGAHAIWHVTVEGLELIRTLIASHSIACDWVSGHMLAAIKPRHVRELRAELELLGGRYDYRGLRLLARDEVRNILATDRYIAALYDPNGGHLHPLNYTLGLAAASERAGAQIFEHTRALDYAARNGFVHVRTPVGELRCRHLVLCGNVYLGDAAPSLRSRIMAVGTYIVATEPLGAERADALIRNGAAVADMNWVIDYFRLTADSRLLFGGRVSYSGLDPFRSAPATRARMVKVFPQLADVRIAHAWGGYLDITLNRAPNFGRLAPNVYFLQGFSGHGIALTGIAGKLVAESIAGTAERFDVFARIPHRNFPGGMAFRRPALMFAMLYYRLRDLL
ncbi:MAG: NAD(P)/FAD-dependent oxidoreductase [Gammaproteobacteria bacterium]